MNGGESFLLRKKNKHNNVLSNIVNNSLVSETKTLNHQQLF